VLYFPNALPGGVSKLYLTGYIYVGNFGVGSGGGGGNSGIVIESSGRIEGLASTINFVGSSITATVSGGTATVNLSGSTGGVLAFGPLYLSYVTTAVDAGAYLDFDLATGAYFFLNTVTVSDSAIVECFSTSTRTDTNPYQFIAMKTWYNAMGIPSSWLVDDGSYAADGNRYAGLPNIFIQILDNPTGNNSYWRVINTNTYSAVYTLSVALLNVSSGSAS
jgi:hypothetical protein